MRKRNLSLILAAATAMIATAVNADEIASAARAVVQKNENAIVKVQIVTQTQMSMDGKETTKRENKSETTATIIDPSGLAVVSLAATNPMEAFSGMGFDDEGINMKSDVTDVKFRMNDGKEIPAKVVLRDKDLDLAFIRPSQKQPQPMPYVDMTGSVRPEKLDQVVVLGRMGKVANRAISACLDRIQAVVEKPRTFFVPGAASMMSDMGSPVFGLNGKSIGLLILRTTPRGDVDDGGFGVGSMGMLPMILPAADIVKVAKQAPEEAPKAAAPAPKPATTPAKPVQPKK